MNPIDIMLTALVVPIAFCAVVEFIEWVISKIVTR